MKKFLILCLAMVVLGGSAWAVNYTPQEKKQFYDGFLSGMFYSLEQSLTQQGFPKAKTTRYITSMKARVNRTELESATWACVSKYTPQQMVSGQKKIADECFGKWVESYMTKNMDLINLLK